MLFDGPEDKKGREESLPFLLKCERLLQGSIF